MAKILKISLFIVFIISTLFYCSKEDWYAVDFDNNITFPTKLSSLELFEDMASLSPANDVHVYEMGATLFTDHAKKQRLIKLPANSQMSKIDNDLPDFPDGTLLAKTFYYFHNEQAPEEGKNIIETRILLKHEGIWNIGTYLWNTTQTDANYIENGHTTDISWLDEQGQQQSLNYSVPKASDCALCHQNNEVILPIGPKLKNLHRDIIVDGQAKNQIQHFQDLDLIHSFSLDEISPIPSYNDLSLPLQDRARAYLDINCAHCHTAGGIAADEGYQFDYHTPLAYTGILWDKDEVIEQMEDGDMPYIGTTVVDEQGLELLMAFIESL